VVTVNDISVSIRLVFYELT